ncbi:Uncharacterised protein [Achromobacter denitrificans]|nr:Uncharacterised protein [Achromobacter denitrificans]
MHAVAAHGARIHVARAVQAGRDDTQAQIQQRVVKVAPGLCFRAVGLVPGRALLPGGLGIRVRHGLAIGARKLRERGEFALTAFAHRLCQRRIRMAGEVQERRAAAAFLAHEDQRNLRRQQLQRDGGAQAFGVLGKLGQPLAPGTVAGLVMVLQEQHEGRGRQVAAGFTTRRALPVRRRLALIQPSFAQAARQRLGGLFRIVGVVAAGFPGQQVMQHMVRVVVPLRVVAFRQQAGAVVVVFQHQVQVALRRHLATDEARQFHQPVGVGNGVYRVQPQAVKAVFRQPVQGIFFKVAAHGGLPEINGGPPGRGHVVAKKGRGVLGQVVAVRAEVVVDHVQHHAQAQPVRGVD